MPDIRYVCLSDMHLGAETSLLTNLATASDIVNVSVPSPALERLVDCLRYLISKNQDKNPKPTLILNGDILELALAEDQNAAMAFERFIDLTMDKGKESLTTSSTTPATTITTCGNRPGKPNIWNIFPRNHGVPTCLFPGTPLIFSLTRCALIS